MFNPVDVNVPIEVADTATPNTFAVLLYNPVVEPLEVTIEGREAVPADAVNTPVADKVVNAPEDAAVPPIAGGDARYVLNPVPDTVVEADKTVNAPVDGVVPPIAPGDANVAPFKNEALKFVTVVCDATVNGAVPVVTVLVTVVNLPVEAVVAPILVLLIVEAAVGLIVKAPAGDIATVPVPVGDKVTVWLDVVADMLPNNV